MGGGADTCGGQGVHLIADAYFTFIYTSCSGRGCEWNGDFSNRWICQTFDTDCAVNSPQARLAAPQLQRRSLALV